MITKALRQIPRRLQTLPTRLFSDLSSSEASDVESVFRDVRTRIDPVKGEVTDFCKHVSMYEE